MSKEKKDSKDVRNLHERLSAVMAAAKGLKRDGKNPLGFTFASHDEITKKLKSELVKQGVGFASSVVDAFAVGKTMVVKIEITYTNLADPNEVLVLFAMGQGSDNQDKALYKAITQAIKVHFLKNFLIPTGDKYSDGDWGIGYEDGAKKVHGTMQNQAQAQTHHNVAQSSGGPASAKLTWLKKELQKSGWVDHPGKCLNLAKALGLPCDDEWPAFKEFADADCDKFVKGMKAAS